MSLRLINILSFVVGMSLVVAATTASAYEPRPPEPPPTPIEYHLDANVNVMLSTYQTLNLNQYFKFFAFRGMRISSVRVVASNERVMDLSVLADHNIVGTHTLNSGHNNLWFTPNRPLFLDSNVRELSLMARGSGVVRIERVYIRLTKY